MERESSPLISSDEEVTKPSEEPPGMAAGPSKIPPGGAAKKRKAQLAGTEIIRSRKRKRPKGARPIAKSYKYTKIHKDRCEGIRRFLEKQRKMTGLSIAHVLSQSLSRPEVSKSQFSKLI